MRKKFILIIVLCLIFSLTASVCAEASQENAPQRIINVVYDDSGSMIKTNGELVDTWCQAKYSMEVFAALLGYRDTMNIYYMSDFESGTNAGPKITLKGTDSPQNNVRKIHETISRAGNTPFNAVKKAYNDLTVASADEKWLVILTDGEFQGIDDIEGYFASKAEDVNVLFLGMGADADAITQDEARHIYFRKAESNSQILQEITSICTQIFNSHRLNVNTSSKTIDFDVPMSELVIFAQGANVTISGIKDAAGKEYLSSTQPVTVQYSEKAATNRTDFTIARDLKGCVATYKDDFTAGKYTLEVSGADTIEVYYKPNIEIAAYLRDASGNEVTAKESLKEGNYTVSFGLVKAGTNERVPESSLLGQVMYSAVVVNNGQEIGQNISSGELLTLKEGQLDIDVMARYLEYNTVSTHLSYQVYSDKAVGFTVSGEDPGYSVTNDGADFSAPIKFSMQLEGGQITQEQWASLGVPEVTVTGENANMFGTPIVEKGTEIGSFLIYPTEPMGGIPLERYSIFEYTAIFNGKVGEASWSGTVQGSAPVKDIRTQITSLTVTQCPTYSVTADGMDVTTPILIRAEFDGETPTQEYWDKMLPLKAEILDGEKSTLYGDIEVEKDSEIGVYRLYPKLRLGLMSYEEYGDFDFAASYQNADGLLPYDGTVMGHVKVSEQRSWFERNIQLVIRLAILLAILLFILGYIPPFKKYLPKALKRRPTIECMPNKAGIRPAKGNGKYDKFLFSTLIPYRAERGTIKIVPPAAPGVPKMQVKATGGSGMLLTNVKAFAGKENIQFNGSSIEAGRTKPLNISASTFISVATKEVTYNSTPNQ